VNIVGHWPTYGQLVADGIRIGAALGAVAGFTVAAGWVWIGLFVGAALGGVVAGLSGRTRHRLRLDAGGIRIGRLTGAVTIPWPEVLAVGRREDWHGRSGRMLGLAVCRRSELLPVPVPALTWTASAMRLGRDHPIDRLAQYRDAALEPVRAWARWQGVPVVEDDLDAWWDHHPAADPDR